MRCSVLKLEYLLRNEVLQISLLSENGIRLCIEILSVINAWTTCAIKCLIVPNSNIMTPVCIKYVLSFVSATIITMMVFNITKTKGGLHYLLWLCFHSSRFLLVHVRILIGYNIFDGVKRELLVVSSIDEQYRNISCFRQLEICIKLALEKFIKSIRCILFWVLSKMLRLVQNSEFKMNYTFVCFCTRPLSSQLRSNICVDIDFRYFDQHHKTLHSHSCDHSCGKFCQQFC